MGNIFDDYYSIYSKLRQYKAELERYDSAISEERNKYRLAVQNANEKLKLLSQDKEAQISRAKALISIAETHTTKHVAGEPRPYNNSILSKLAVQVSSGIKDDPYATMLYTEATGQLQQLEYEKSQFDKLLEMEIARVGAEANARCSNLLQSVEIIKRNVKALLISAEMQNLISRLKSDRRFFCSTDDAVLSGELKSLVTIGYIEAPFPVLKGLEDATEEATKGFCNLHAQTIQLPVRINITSGDVLFVEYDNETENETLAGLQNLLFNSAKYYCDDFSQVVFIDSARPNIGSLGILAPLSAGRGSFIDPVPTSQDEIKKKLETIITEQNIREARSASLGIQKRKSLYIFHNFPQNYPAQAILLIQQLCLTAKHFDSVVVVTRNTSVRTYNGNDTLSLIQQNSLKAENLLIGGRIAGTYKFTWYPVPKALPAYMVKSFIEEKSVINTSNIYEERIGFQSTGMNKKGIRKLTNIPFGIDQDGEIQYLDFENSNFATFICGAARSGKSTLLHTLISGFIQNNHPDDIEIWLIDFKMTEFSRYISHMPPHIRYIVLDESPELVYDIIDRLTDILTKRQNIFKGKWQKLGEVPAEKYMPAILVIIDEFSVMSQIVSDSAFSSSDNYMVKLQMLLAKGAALGLHFIFASQGFTSGTRGLNDFSKKQVQQRIAMKTEYSEIKDTLDLRSPSEEDKAFMEQLPVHFALTRIPADEKGNHLRLSQVLYISDFSVQESMIDTMRTSINPTPKYDWTDISKYISKQPMVIDGSTFSSFENKSKMMCDYVSQRHSDEIGDELFLFIGEPRRLLKNYPIYITSEFCQNVLIISPLSEVTPACSVIMSMLKSCEMQDFQVEVWSPKRNPLFRQVVSDNSLLYAVYNDLDDICGRISTLRKNIESKKATNKVVFLLGYESMVNDFIFSETGNKPQRKVTAPGITIERRTQGKPDINTLLASLSMGKTEEVDLASADSVRKGHAENTINSITDHDDYSVIDTKKTVYDAREDLKFILSNGPRMGYHFVVSFNNAAELAQTRMDIALFRHKIMFRAAKGDATMIMGATNAAVITDLQDHSFRYSDGMDNVSFRPFLHPSLSWDGWQIDSSGKVVCVEEDEEYLL